MSKTNSLFNNEGYVKTRPKQNRKPYGAQKYVCSQEEIDFCLNCTEAKCNGKCKKFKEAKRNGRI